MNSYPEYTIQSLNESLETKEHNWIVDVISIVIEEMSSGNLEKCRNFEPRKLPNTKRELDSVSVVLRNRNTAKDFKYGIYFNYSLRITAV